MRTIYSESQAVLEIWVIKNVILGLNIKLKIVNRIMNLSLRIIKYKQIQLYCQEI